MTINEVFENYKHRIFSLEVMHQAFYFQEQSSPEQKVASITTLAYSPALDIKFLMVRNSIFKLSDEDTTKEWRCSLKHKRHTEVVFDLSQERTLKLKIEGGINE